MKIPKRIHYIWFSARPLPPHFQVYIDGWKALMPDFEVTEWNASNFDVTQHPYMQKMHDLRKFAFASDLARLLILKEHGGFYLDTDVELKKSLVPFLNEQSLWSFEFDSFLSTCIIGSVPQHALLEDLVHAYDGLAEGMVNNAIVTAHFINKYPEFRLNNKDQVVGNDIRILPKEYFVLPSFDKSIDHGVHHASNHWNDERGGLRYSWLVRKIIGEVLFFKLVNMKMNWNSEFKAMERARR